MQITITEAELKKSIELALQAREKAYAPYSLFKVGACIQLFNHEFVSGCNVENRSYGATVCAERNALFAACAQFGTQEVRFLTLVTNSQNFDSPCGLCLQVMSEFLKPDTPIFLCNLNGRHKEVQFKDLLPMPFINELKK